MELFKLLGSIAIDNTKANKALQETGKRAGTTATEIESAVNKVGSFALGIAKGIGTIAGIMGGAWIAAIESTREYRTQMGQLDTAFQAAGHSSEEAKSTYTELNAVLGDSGQAVEASQHLAKLTDNEKDLKTWTEICTGVYATFGESLPIEGLTEAANETAKTGELTGGLTDALNWAGIGEEEFQEKLDKCTNEQERQKLIMDTLNKTYSEASEQYKENNKDILEANKANERLTAAFAELGRVGEPILTAVKNAVADMVEAAAPHLENLIGKVKDAITWIKENEETVNAWAGAILGAVTAIGAFLLILNWGKMMSAAANALKTVRLAMLALNSAMLSNPVGLVVALLAGLVAAFVYLWNNVEGFRVFWINAWENIKSAASKAKTAVTNAFKNLGAWFKNIFNQVQKAGSDAMNKVSKWFSNAYKKITNTFSNIGSWFKNKFNSAWTGIKNVFSGWGKFFSGLWTEIKEKFSSVGSSIGESMGNAVKNGLNTVLSKVETTINKGIGLINSAIRLANKLPGIDVGTVKLLSLPRLAKGGVLEKGQIGLLEGSGAEAVVPLEKNNKWLSRVAEEMTEIQMNKGHAYDSGANTTEIIDLLRRIVSLIEKVSGKKIMLDTGAIVGELTPAIDARLSSKLTHLRRGNTI